MRSKYDNTIAGSGTYWAFYEQEDKEIDRDHKMHVTLPNEKGYEDLHGPVKTYHISELEGGSNEGNQQE